MASSNEVSKKTLEDIKGMLGNLNDDHVWNLINEIRDTCNVIIPVWFTPTLVKEICEDDLDLSLSDEQTEKMIGIVNDNDTGYSLGRELVVNLIDSNLCFLDDENEDDKDEEEKPTNENITLSCVRLLTKEIQKCNLVLQNGDN